MSGHGTRITLLEQHIDAHPSEDVDIGFEFHELLDVGASHKARYKPSLSLKKQLSFKYLLSLEGNDVASGLKWMLYSSSVVFMPPPTVASWAMEDKLIPFYHYIPLAPDLSDLKDLIQWARDNDETCQLISRHATRFMEDLWVSDKAKSDNEEILESIIHRYQDNYGSIVNGCSNGELVLSDSHV